MTTLTVTAKGQITLQKKVLAHLGVRPGQKVEVELLPGGRMVMHAAPTGALSEAFGLLARPKQKALSLDEMNEVIAAGWAEQP